MGSVNSGLLTLSAFHSTGARRFDLPGKESWLRQQLDLDRPARFAMIRHKKNSP
ncbi:hypothetical protein ACE3MQ_11065 [Paenibacillus lentus]